MSKARVSPYLSVRTVIVLRNAAHGANLRSAIAARGAVPVLLPALRLAAMPDPDAARHALRGALLATQLIFTSPAAVRYAAALSPLRADPAQRVYALGRGTARALQRHGLSAIYPGAGAMHSEGLLALPDFAASRYTQGGDVGLVTAPGGRGLIAHALRARGAQLRVAEVYRRLPPRFDRRHFAALQASPAPRALLVTSGEALQYALAALPAELGVLLREARTIASSARLARLAQEHGFAQVDLAAEPGADALLDALARQ
jgi:uroporphyrinogen-III synthase